MARTWKDWFGTEGILINAGCCIATLIVLGCLAIAMGWKILKWGGLIHAS